MCQTYNCTFSVNVYVRPHILQTLSIPGESHPWELGELRVSWQTNPTPGLWFCFLVTMGHPWLQH